MPNCKTKQGPKAKRGELGKDETGNRRNGEIGISEDETAQVKKGKYETEKRCVSDSPVHRFSVSFFHRIIHLSGLSIIFTI